jgi:hypothetical protein
LYKNQLSQLEVCRGSNVSLSNKVSRLEESIRIIESKNLYLQDENQRLKGVNEGISSNRVGQNTQNSENQCNPRVLILENDSLTTKLKMLEQNFELKMETIKSNLEKKLEKAEDMFNSNISKQKEYFYDKLYEIRSPAYHNQNECRRKINDVIKEQDRFNVKLIKTREAQEKFPSEIKVVKNDLSNLKKSIEDLEATQRRCPLNSSVIEGGKEEENVSTLSEIIDPEIVRHPNEEFIKKNNVGHPICNENLGWKTPEAMHRSFNEMISVQTSSRVPHKSVITNRYRLEYTASPAQERFRENESEMNTTVSQPFLDKRQVEQLDW